jgi:hypothetical protein
MGTFPKEVLCLLQLLLSGFRADLYLIPPLSLSFRLGVQGYFHPSSDLIDDSLDPSWPKMSGSLSRRHVTRFSMEGIAGAKI